MSHLSNSTWVGIDVGTSYCSIGVYQNGECVLIPDDLGKKRTPTCLAITKNEILLGDAAKEEGLLNPEVFVDDFVRLIGRTIEDDYVCKNEKLNLQIFQKNNKIGVQVKNPKPIFLTIEMLYALVLYKLKQRAENHLRVHFVGAVIVVPTSFNDAQRRAVINAAKMAEIARVELLNSLVSIANAYDLNRDRNQDPANIMMLNFGGGITELCVWDRIHKRLHFSSIMENNLTGGKDIDKNLIIFCLKEFQNKHCIDLRTNPVAMLRLQEACKKVKISLSRPRSLTTRIFVKAICDNVDFEAIVDQDKFENLNKKTFEYYSSIIQMNVTVTKEMHAIVLVGGVSRLNFIQNEILRRFPSIPIDQAINADEATALGAVWEARINTMKPGIKKSLRQYVYTYSMNKKNVKLKPGQFQIFENENCIAVGNCKSQPKITVNQNGVLTVTESDVYNRTGHDTIIPLAYKYEVDDYTLVNEFKTFVYGLRRWSNPNAKRNKSRYTACINTVASQLNELNILFSEIQDLSENPQSEKVKDLLRRKTNQFMSIKENMTLNFPDTLRY